MAAPIEPKVKAGSAAAAVAGVADWFLVQYLFPHMHDPTGQALILAAVPGVVAFAGGWLAHHQQRPAPGARVAGSPPPSGNVAVQPPGYPASGPPMSSLPPTAAMTNPPPPP